MSKNRIEKLIEGEIKKQLESQKKILDEDFQPRSSLKNFQRQRGGMMMGLMGGGGQQYNNPMEQPGGYNPPEVDGYDPKFEGKKTDHFDRGYSALNENGIKLEDGGRELTAEAHLLLNTGEAKNHMEESVGWHMEEDGWYFGKYPLRTEVGDKVSWSGILEELAEEGPVLPITVHVYENGKVHLHESEYGVGAYDTLGIQRIPAHVKWYGNVQGTEKDQLQEYFKRSFYPKNAESLDHYFDEMDGINFMSDGKRVNWVDDSEDVPLSPAEAFRTGEYEEKGPRNF